MASSILKDQINLKKVSSHAYTISYHHDWTVGPVLHGGCVAAALHHAATTHFNSIAADQPDILTLHLDFLRPCELCDSEITVEDLKVGAGTSTIQLRLSQKGQTKVIALATSCNFIKSVGPTALSAWNPGAGLSTHPIPNFEGILANKPDQHWLPAHLVGEIIPFTRRQLCLNPREGFPVDGVCDAWNTFLGDERMDATYLAMMADCIPSMSDTILRNGGIYDARRSFAIMEKWDAEHPGVPAELTNSFKQAMQTPIFSNTVTLDIEFKRRLPSEGVKWTFTRAATRMLEGGRMDLDITICNENMEILCLARQVILALDAKRKFRDSGTKKAAL
ncbi:thioesterase family protein [Xylaria scruposa]|nr:thioesterase family protein [Xylaria scruposa]